uniref:Uncharacterized protein n=1 Tax=Micrurus corallinus TaxID=54390 RepID=A0A2D4GG63_MICCO
MRFRPGDLPSACPAILAFRLYKIKQQDGFRPKIIFGPDLYDQYTLRSGDLLLVTSPPSQNWLYLEQKNIWWSLGYFCIFHWSLSQNQDLRREWGECCPLKLSSNYAKRGIVAQ